MLIRRTLPWLLALAAAVPTAALGQSLPHAEEHLPLAREIRDRLNLDEASPEELLAGAMAQFNYFFPAGVASPVMGRAQLDALLAATILLEEGLRRGSVSYDHAHALFECYAVMYATGRSGALSRTFEGLLGEMEGAGEQEREVIGLYRETLDEFEEFGLNGAMTLGDLLVSVRPERTDVAYTLARIAEEEGRLEEARTFFRHGLEGERYPERLMALAELESTAGNGHASDALTTATGLAPALSDEAAAMTERVERRQRMRALEQRHGDGDASRDEQYELARLYRQEGRLVDALGVYEGLGDWSGAPDSLLEDYAVTAMEANLPERMSEVLADTRSRSPSSRLLQLRLAAGSVSVIRGAMGARDGFDLDDFLETEDGRLLSEDLSAYADFDSAGARFVRVYLDLVVALVELRRSGAIDEDRAEALAEAVVDLREVMPDSPASYRFELMLALYRRDTEALESVLEGFGEFCAAHECQDELRRTASLVLLQTAAKLGVEEPLDGVDRMLEEWPDGARDPLYHLVRGTAALLRSHLGRPSSRERERLVETAREAFLEGVRYQPAAGETVLATGADYAALYNNLAYLALEERELGVAKLYLEAARRFNPTHAIALLNLGVALAQAQNFVDAFVTFGLGAGEAASDPALSFQILRWAGHLYQIAGQDAEARAAYQRALGLHESGEDWTSGIDDGIFPGGPVEWGLLYEDETGLVVNLDLTSAPLFFVPAPVSVLEMSASGEGD